MGSETYPLDAIDARLLQELQADAKISLKAVGERVGLSAPAVMERLRKMEQAGVILGYHAQVDARKVGLDVAASSACRSAIRSTFGPSRSTWTTRLGSSSATT